MPFVDQRHAGTLSMEFFVEPPAEHEGVLGAQIVHSPRSAVDINLVVSLHHVHEIVEQWFVRDHAKLSTDDVPGSFYLLRIKVNSQTCAHISGDASEVVPFQIHYIFRVVFSRLAVLRLLIMVRAVTHRRQCPMRC